jgi:hypothetical protein
MSHPSPARVVNSYTSSFHEFLRVGNTSDGNGTTTMYKEQSRHDKNELATSNGRHQFIDYHHHEAATMTIVYALVSRQKTVLAEFTATSGE